MKTFKQFLGEIKVDDRAISFDQSHGVVRRLNLDNYPKNQWTPLLRLNTGNTVIYKKMQSNLSGTFQIVLVGDESDKNEAAIYMELESKSVKVASRNLIGVETTYLASHPDYRGKNLPLLVYQALIDHGQVLFSSNLQTTGSKLLWEKLVRQNPAFVLASGSAARWYANRYNKDTATAHVLLTGSIERLSDEAYADRHSHWVVVPRDLNDLDVLRREAIQLDPK